MFSNPNAVKNLMYSLVFGASKEKSSTILIELPAAFTDNAEYFANDFTFLFNLKSYDLGRGPKIRAPPLNNGFLMLPFLEPPVP